MKKKLLGFLRGTEGNFSVEFIFSTTMLILVFSVLVSALVYVTQFYSASYICRRVVRTIEVTGKYDTHAVNTLRWSATSTIPTVQTGCYC